MCVSRSRESAKYTTTREVFWLSYYPAAHMDEVFQPDLGQLFFHCLARNETTTQGIYPSSARTEHTLLLEEQRACNISEWEFLPAWQLRAHEYREYSANTTASIPPTVNSTSSCYKEVNKFQMRNYLAGNMVMLLGDLILILGRWRWWWWWRYHISVFLSNKVSVYSV